MSTRAPSPSKAPRTPLPFEVWALVAGGFCVALGYGVLAPAIPQYASTFGVTTLAASAIISAFALMRLVGAPLGGWAVSRFGERRTYTIGILVVAASTGACALASTYPQLLILRGAGGIGSAMFTVAASALLIKVSPPEARGRVASMNAAGFLSGTLTGPVFGALVAGYGLRAPFVFYFCTLVLAAVVVWWSLRNSQFVTAPARTDERRSTDFLTFRAAARISQYRAVLLSAFTFGWASFGVRVSLVPLFIAAAFQGNASQAAWVLAAYAAGNALLIFPSGHWNDSWGRKPMLVIGLSVLAVTYSVFPASPSLWIAAVVMAVAGAGSALIGPGQQAVMADVVNKKSGGQVVAGYSMSSDLGAVAGPLLAGALVDAAGFGPAFWVTGGLLACAAVVWSIVPDTTALRKDR